MEHLLSVVVPAADSNDGEPVSLERLREALRVLGGKPLAVVGGVDGGPSAFERVVRIGGWTHMTPDRVRERNAKHNAERVNDIAKRMLHRLIARRLPHEPDLLERACLRVRPSDDGRPQPDYVAKWRALLDLPVADLRRRITERSETMDRLRISSPLLGDGHYADEGLRRRIWRAARRITSRIKV